MIVISLSGQATGRTWRIDGVNVLIAAVQLLCMEMLILNFSLYI